MHNIKQAIIVPFILIAGLFFSGYMLSAYFDSQKSDDLHLQNMSVRISQYIKNRTADDARILEAAIAPIRINQNFTAAFINGDRDELYALSKELFHQLRQRHNITHFYFSDAKRVNFLRVHQPDRYGDIINRFTARTAEKTKKISVGVEIGPLGTFTLRVVVPWMDNGKLLGYLELGKEINYVFSGLPAVIPGTTFVFVHKKYLNRQSWESGMRMLNQSPEWNRFDDVVLTNSEPYPFVNELVKTIAGVNYAEDVVTRILTKGDRMLSIVGYPIRDIEQKNIGYFVFTVDDTIVISQKNQRLLLIALGGIFFMILTVWVFWLLLTRVEKQFSMAVEKRKESENLLALHLDNTPVGVIAWNSDFNCTQWNSAAEKIFGFTADEALGGNALKLFVPEEIHDQIDGTFEALLNQCGGNHSINENVTKDGRRILCEWFNTPLKGKDGVPIGVASIVRDITAEKSAEAALLESEERFRAVIEYAPGAIVIKDLSGKNQIVNKTFCDWYATDRENIINNSAADFIAKESVEIMVDQEREVVETGEVVVQERRVTYPDGIARDVSTQKFPILSSEGKIVAVGTIINDITARKKAEAALIVSMEREVSQKTQSALINERLHNAIESFPNGFVLYDPDDRLVMCNQAFREIWIGINDLIKPGVYFHELVIAIMERGLVQKEETTNKKNSVLNRLKHGLEDNFLEIQMTNGRWILHHDHRTPDGGHAGIRIDITERKHLEMTLRETKEEAEQTAQELRKLSQAVEQSPATVVITDHKGIIEYVNPKFEETTGFTFIEVVGQTPRIISSGEKTKEEYEELWQTITSGSEWHGVFHNKRKDGSLFWESTSISPIRDSNGQITHFLALKEDITDFKNTEEALQRAQKMEAVGHLTGGIAHDFNNILGIIMGNLEILQRMLFGDEKALGRVEMALKGANRAADITKKLLNFSRMDTHEERLISVNTFIENQKDLISKSLTASIKVETHLFDDLWEVVIDPGDLEDTLLNLSINARDAMPEGGTLFIETANKVLDEGYVKQNPESKTGEFVMISVSDNGMGMTEEIRERVLDPFFTTKEQGKGTGLGLSMVYGFVKRSGGHIKIYSEIGEGTTIRIYLPRTHERVTVDGGKYGSDAERPCGTETILVVDDEEDLLDIATSYLEDLGYKTLSATSAKQALKVLEGNEDIDLLFSDIIMPGMDGYQLVLAAHEIHPALKVLLASGFTKKREEQVNGEDKYLAQLIANLLGKPYNQSELALAIRRVLDNEA